MDRMLYIAMSGARQTSLAQHANSNNLANISTTGFLADLTAFKSTPVYGPGHNSRVYATTEEPSVDFTPGMIKTTNRDLDIAVNGEGWITVQAKDGSEAYTRAGDLRVDASGLLVTGTGLPVMGNGGPITIPPAKKIDVGTDGTISIVPLGQQPNALAVLDRIKLVQADRSALYKGNDGLIRSRDGNELESDASIKVVPGSLETSNVSSVSSLVNMITLARQYETQIKLMKTAEETDSATDQLMQI